MFVRWTVHDFIIALLWLCVCVCVCVCVRACVCRYTSSQGTVYTCKDLSHQTFSIFVFLSCHFSCMFFYSELVTPLFLSYCVLMFLFSSHHSMCLILFSSHLISSCLISSSFLYSYLICSFLILSHLFPSLSFSFFLSRLVSSYVLIFFNFFLVYLIFVSFLLLSHVI